MASLFNSFASSIATNIASAVVDTVRRATGTSLPYTVLDATPQQFSKMKVVYNEEDVTLYADKNVFICVLNKPLASSQAFSLFRVVSESEAVEQFNNFSFKLQTLLNATENKLMTRDKLQMLSDVIRANIGWNCAHIAAKLGLVDCFTTDIIAEYLSIPDDVTGMTPIMVAIETEDLECVKELIIRGARLDLSDNKGLTVFHYAAKASNETIIQYLASKDRSTINKLDVAGESALHTSCLNDQPQNTLQLLKWGFDPNVTDSTRYPIHCAADVSSVRCMQTLCRWTKSQVNLQDKKTGGTPLHWSKTRECINALADLGANLDARNFVNETPLHIAVRENNRECAMALLAKGADAELIGQRGNNALHMAIETDNPDLVQLLIVFGTAVNGCNADNVCPRHAASTSDGENKDYILYLLHRVGAARCKVMSNNCQQGCAPGGQFDGTPKNTVDSTPDEHKKLHCGAMSELAMVAAMSRSSSTHDCAAMLEVDSPMKLSPAGDRVLCLDGGGIRGLILIQLLQAIENTAGQPIRNCFDWIAGTSTGSILALAIVQGKSVRHCLGAYFQLKDDIFCGKRPYSSEPLENFLKRELGETTRMSEKEYPRVMVTTVLADRMPAELHLFKNYEIPGVTPDVTAHVNTAASSLSFEPLPRYTEQYVWQAARSSGAAPTYFRAFGRFLDGGLMSNNPTLDMLTEIHHYNIALNSLGRAHQTRPIHVLVSLGTGRIPQKMVTDCDLYRPEGIFDLAKVMYGARNLAELLVDQATQSEGRAVERAAAWCSTLSVPYFRFSPRLSEDISLDCKDDKTLVNMLWETQCYIHEHRERITQLANLLRT